MKQVQTLPIESVKQNTGQIAGLPSNPRQWKQEDIDRIAKSLSETPELFDARPLIVYPHNEEYIIMGGNLRYEGAKKNGMQIVPVHILPENMDVDKLKEIVLKDNGSFGEWDFDALANEWDDLPLADWGIPASFLGEGNWDELSRIEEPQKLPDLVQKITVTIPPTFVDNMEDIKAAIELTIAEWDGVKVS